MNHGGVGRKRRILHAVFFISVSLSSQISLAWPSDRIPFRLSKGHILVAVSLNDGEGLTLDFNENYLEFQATDGLISSQAFVTALAFVPLPVQCGGQTLVFMLDSAGIDLILFEECIRSGDLEEPRRSVRYSRKNPLRWLSLYRTARISSSTRFGRCWPRIPVNATSRLKRCELI